jgi:hypothetical protein
VIIPMSKFTCIRCGRLEYYTLLNCIKYIYIHSNLSIEIKYICLFVYLYPSDQFLSYPASVSVTDDRAANLDLCL